VSLHFLSWNVNGIRACVKKGLIPFLNAQKADFVCLQEVKASEEQVEEALKPLKGYEICCHSAERPGYSGVLTLHRKRARSIQCGVGQKKIDQEGRVILSNLGEVLLINTYYPNGAMNEERHLFKMRFMKNILEFYRKLDQEKPLILGGDFNIAHKSIDIHDPVRLDGTSGFKPEERAWLDDLLKAGFVDSFRALNPQKKAQYSWWSYRQGSRKRNKGWRIDYFFISEKLRKQIIKAEIHAEIMGSDHCPISLILKC